MNIRLWWVAGAFRHPWGITNHSYKPSEVSTIIDTQNKFILITLQLPNVKITFKDSYRIFPVSLPELCQVFGVKGKTNQYKLAYNDLNLLSQVKLESLTPGETNPLLREFVEYSKQDAKALYDALVKAQEQFMSTHNVDITSILSITSLALKIFRTNYLETPIPILKTNQDNFIRKSYFGGATDYYLACVKGAHYYDVNSLYPFAMTKDMPVIPLKHHLNLSERSIKLNGFFGFCLAEIFCPDSIERPVLPYRFKGKTIFPRGR